MNTYMQKVTDSVNVDTGEMIAKTENIEIGTTAAEVFVGISMLDISRDISDKLLLPVKVEEVEIKPTGEIYLSHVRYRRMLNEAFGMGNWALRPLGGFVKTGNIVCREYALYIRGKYAASAIGEQAYLESNAMMTWSDACEATKSNVIMRCCKDLGIGLEMWDKKFVEKFKKDFCCQVWRKETKKPQWRLIESNPFFDETGIVDPTKKQVPATRPPMPGESTESPEVQQHKQELSDAIDGKTSQPYGGKTVVGIVAVTQQQGGKKGNPWIRYRIKSTDGEWATFDKKIADAAKLAQEGGYGVIPVLATKGKYTNIVGLERIPADTEEAPTIDGINIEPLPWEFDLDEKL